jgi:cytochrome c oxidase assembly protein subunit 15
MTHRYFAATLGALILGLALIALFYPRSMRPRERSLALLLLGLVIFQGLLGMWTVTLKLLPVVVMGHLLGGFSTLALLWWLWQTQHSIAQHPKPLPPLTYLRLTQLSWLTLTMLSLQIMLGAWTSANYAALSCPDFPWCQGQLWPTWQWQALNLLGASSHDQPLTFMSLEARMSIQMLHRWGAVLTTICVVTLIWQLRQIAADAKEGLSTRKHTWLLLSLLSCQIGLGITNVIAVLPLPVAVAHNGIAALLLLSVLHLLFELHHPYRNATS